ncbi:SDR family oxidoreductase [Paenibacillus sp. BC26]|uniref:dTDP-4-dehydrorhamnose reductase family protein n=1 Tax=Paenibacillus sp. BC26 TaxID=1881032 RepID=UPI0008E0B087|nr:SDR family oxidoreductase [Paenibacillus sp. BC26]SFS51099.1 dTDP-4-dehydrorhamnose reductase [Paenibacillus sp. BC26]
MKLLIIGGSGMAGHVLIRYFAQLHPEMDVVYTTRAAEEGTNGLRLDASDSEAVAALVHAVQPDVIVNAVGVLNQDAEQHPLAAYQVNGFLPHWLRHLADHLDTPARVIHISSDCVFSGSRGGYTEQDVPDGTSVYGRSKALGEAPGSRHLTIRTSIIGPEIRPNGIGLLKWFLEQKGTVSGYARVWWNGVTTLELAKAVDYAIANPTIGGLVHLTAAETISKLTLLHLFQSTLQVSGIKIVPDDRLYLDRTLAATRSDWGYVAPSYVPMLEELANWMSEG